jgi:hypothetical protein
MNMRLFRDSTNPGAISASTTDGVLAYANGDYAWDLAEVERFIVAGKQVVHIDVNGTAPHRASVLDVERYDATPQTARDWIRQRNIYRRDATVYCGKDNLAELFAATAGLDYWLLVADWTGSPHNLAMPLPDLVMMAGTQFVSLPSLFDSSAIYADGWHPANHRDWIPV